MHCYSYVPRHTHNHLYNTFYNFIEDCHSYFLFLFFFLLPFMFICYLVVTLGSFHSVELSVCKFECVFPVIYSRRWGKIGFLFVLTSKFITNHKIYFFSANFHTYLICVCVWKENSTNLSWWLWKYNHIFGNFFSCL